MEKQEVEILLIEDNLHEAELTIRSLKKHHLANRLKHIDDGSDALDFIFSTGVFAGDKSQFNPKLILLDLKLPKVDGLEVLKQIRANEKTSILPVVILTSSKEEQDLIQGYASGCNSYVVKPVDMQQFLDSVKSLELYWLVINQGLGD